MKTTRFCSNPPNNRPYCAKCMCLPKSLAVLNLTPCSSAKTCWYAESCDARISPIKGRHYKVRHRNLDIDCVCVLSDLFYLKSRLFAISAKRPIFLLRMHARVLKLQAFHDSVSLCLISKGLDQQCPIRAACGSVEGFVRPSLGFHCSKSILHTDTLSLFW